MRWIIGDIHGMLAPLEAILRAVSARDSAAELFFVGDYVNRGPDSRGVIDVLLTLSNAHFIRGNHDDAFDTVLTGDGQSRHDMLRTRAFALRSFLNYGMDTTLLSYGLPRSEITRIAQNPKESVLDDLAARIPQTHRDFIRGLKPLKITDSFFITHAKLPLDALPQHAGQHLDSLIWGRFTRDEIPAEKVWAQRGYFGHTAVQNYSGLSVPILGNKMILLDTGAVLYDDGRLTAYCHEEETFIQSDPRGKIV